MNNGMGNSVEESVKPLFHSSCDDTEYPSSLSDPLPESWKTEEDEFICVYVLNLPYVDSSTLLAPDCLARDGLLWLLIVRKVVIDR